MLKKCNCVTLRITEQIARTCNLNGAYKKSASLDEVQHKYAQDSFTTGRPLNFMSVEIKVVPLLMQNLLRVVVQVP